MKFTVVVVFALALLGVGGAFAQERTTVSLDGMGWKFARDNSADTSLDASSPAFDDSAWRAVEVPHDWAIEGPFDSALDGGTGKLPWRGVGWLATII